MSWCKPGCQNTNSPYCHCLKCGETDVELVDGHCYLCRDDRTVAQPVEQNTPPELDWAYP